MSRKITEDEFLKRFYTRFPEADVEIIQYDSIKKDCTLKCKKCGKEYTKKAESFISSWRCCGYSNESKVELIKRLCSTNPEYDFIKQLDNFNVIIKHKECGTENKRNIQSAVLFPFSCTNCDTRSNSLRLSIQEAQQRLDEHFNGDITVLSFSGVDVKTKFRCNKCGLIFTNSLQNLISGCRGCPKCDQRKSKGERAMRKYLDERGIEYDEQVRFKELGALSFDFAIKTNGKYTALIEVQGDQHYREVFRYKSRPNYFQTQQRHDQEKRDWCKKQGLPLYEIINDSGKLLNLDILPF